jgi:hypothetical protein
MEEEGVPMIIVMAVPDINRGLCEAMQIHAASDATVTQRSYCRYLRNGRENDLQ